MTLHSVIFAGFFGFWQIILILLVILLFFGGKKIPELMKGIGKGIKEFKDGVSEKEENKKDTTDNNL